MLRNYPVQTVAFEQAFLIDSITFLLLPFLLVPIIVRHENLKREAAN